MEEELALMIPIVSIVLGIGLAFWVIYWEYQKKRLQYQERQLMIEKGMEPPPVLLDEEKKKMTLEDCLRRGIIMLFLGIGFGIIYFMVSVSEGDGPLPWLFGTASAIVGLLGAGYLTYYAIAKRQKSEEPPADTVL
jgi:uncharacterized membrane protein YfcA